MISIAHKEITKDYGDSVIENVWVNSNSCHVERSETSQSLESTQSTKETTRILGTMQAIKDSMLETLQTAQDSIICLYTSFLDNEILTLVQAIGDNNRIYIYTKDQNTLQELSHHSLVRLGDNLAGSFVLIQKDKNIQGFFSTKDFDIESNQLFLELDSNQCNDFWHYFITCFWKDAKKEFIAGKEEEIKEMNQKDFIPPFQNGFDTEFIRDSILQEKSNALIQLQKNSPLIELLQDFEECRFLLQDSKVLSGEVLENSTTSNFVTTNVGFDSIDTDIFLSDNTILYRLSLNDTQNKTFKSLRESFVITKSFKHSITLKELIDKTIYYLDGKTAKIEAHTTHIDSIQCTSFLDKDEFETQELDYKEIRRNKYPHICEIIYSFDILPFYTPTDFETASLYNEWDNTHKALHNTIDKALKNIESIYEKQDELNAFQALLSEVKKIFQQSFLGKNTNLKHIATELNKIKQEATLEALSIDSTQSYIKDLQKYIKTISENSGEIDLKLDEAKEHNKWQVKKNELEKKIEELQKKCDNNRQHIDSKEREYKDKLQSGPATLQNATDHKSKDIEYKNKENQNKQALNQYINTEKEQLQKHENELESLKSDLENKYKEFHYKKKEPKESKSPLAFMDKKSEKQNIKECDINIPIPKENRPSIGTLKEGENKRLLEISSWSEVESAKSEAQRLGANLSVKN